MKVCVFTAIFSEKAPIDKPGSFAKINGWDYIMFTNLDPATFGKCSWEIRQIPPPFDNVPKEPKVGTWIYANRYYKWQPQRFLSDYDVVIYNDGFQAPNIKHEKIWKALVAELSDPGATYSIIQCPHNLNNCIYQELDAIVFHRKDIRPRMDNVGSYLSSVGFPRKYGLFWNGCYILDNRCKKLEKVMSDLWDDMIKFTYRDQALYMYELWKNQAYEYVRHYNLETIVKNLHECRHHIYV